MSFPPRMRAYTDLSLMLLTFVSTVVWNVEVGIAVSVIMSLLLVVHRSSKTRMTILVSDKVPPLLTKVLTPSYRVGCLERISGDP